MSRLGRVLRDRGVQRRMGAAALSGVLLALAFPAFDIGVLALVALVPLVWAWRGETPGRAALYGFVFGVVFAGILMYWLWYFGIVAIVPLVAGWAAYTALTGYLVGCLNRAGAPIAVAHRGGVGRPRGAPRTLALRRVCRGATSASRSTTSRPRAWWRAGAASRSCRSCSSCSTPISSSWPSRSAVHERRSIVVATAGVGVVVVLVAGADVARYQTHPSGELRVAVLQGNDQDRYLTTEEKRSGYLTEQHFALANQLRGRYDLVVFPESSLDDFSPESNPSLRSRLVARGSPARCGRARRTRPSPAPDGRDFNQNLLYTPDGRLAGTYAKRASRPVRRVRAVPVAGRLDRHRRPHPVRLHAGEGADHLPGQGPPGRDGDLLRVGVRAARPGLRRSRRRGRRGEHQQPLVPALGQLGPAHRARRRCGQPRRDARSCRRRSRG